MVPDHLFKALCVTFLIWLTYMLYLVRMRRYAKSMKVRFDERLSERTRLARELHDTLLQTIQGSKLVADGLEEYLDDPPRAKRLWLSFHNGFHKRWMRVGRASNPFAIHPHPKSYPRPFGILRMKAHPARCGCL